MESCLHQLSGEDIEWTRVNTAEAIPGVLTPLSWSLWSGAIDACFREGYGRLGLVSARVRRARPVTVNERFSGIFFGRPANNLTLVRQAVTQLSGGSDAELSFYGSTAGRTATRPSALRRARLSARMTIRCVFPVLRLRRIRRTADRFWSGSIARMQAESVGAAAAAFGTAGRLMRRWCADQAVWSTLVLMAQTRLEEQLAANDLSDAAGNLLGGYGAMEELAWANALSDVSSGQLSIDGFVAAFGFHGPTEGELSSRSWREDQDPLRAILAAHIPEEQDARALVEQRRHERTVAEAMVISRCHGWRRLRLRRSLHRASKLMPLRGVCKVAYIQALDVCRCAARTVGADLVERDLLDDPDDVFFLAADELFDRPPDMRELVERRRAERDTYSTMELPSQWTGNPVPGTRSADRPGVASGSGSSAGAARPPLPPGHILQGIGVSPGVRVGRARIVSDLRTDTLAHGEILVSHTTDPSWASYLVMAGAAVIDIGGPLSHGAMIARELGLPCVINTKVATDQLADGDLIRVDGTTGTVELLEHAENGPA